MNWPAAGMATVAVAIMLAIPAALVVIAATWGEAAALLSLFVPVILGLMWAGFYEVFKK